MKRFLRVLMLLLVRIIGIPGAYAARQQAQRPISQTPRILLLRPDHLGDLVLTTPVLEALRKHAPNAQITMMVGPWSSEIVARHPAIDRLLTCPFPGFQRAPQKSLTPYFLLFSIAQQLRRGNYDLAINLRPDFWWGAALLYLARIPCRVGYAISISTPFLTHALPFPTPEHATRSNLRLISAGLQARGYQPLEEPYTPERYPLQFTPTEEEHHWVQERLKKAGIDAESPVIVIHPGTGADVKLWRPEAWANCANILTSTSLFPTAVYIILTGSRHERPMLEEIAQHIMPPPPVITDATVGQLAALLKRAQLVLGVDNGPLHLAVAQGTPTIALFGPTDARIFGPWGTPEQHIVIASTQRCAGCPMIPCGRLDFGPEDLAAHPCVRLIPEKRVIETVTTILKNCNQANPMHSQPLQP
ncbi:MAG TPA: glycosyltransferase family 9 protein [Ktedonobacteraceae bacterium]|nr:glycosyltransferase family 9 protein [Ktedonobacteraceae bacterium]